MTATQEKWLDSLEQYARKKRSEMGYGLYPPVAENAAAIEILTNVLAYCLLIRKP